MPPPGAVVVVAPPPPACAAALVAVVVAPLPPLRSVLLSRPVLWTAAYVVSLCAVSYVLAALFFVPLETRQAQIQALIAKSKTVAAMDIVLRNPQLGVPDKNLKYGAHMLGHFKTEHTSRIADLAASFVLYVATVFNIGNPAKLPGSVVPAYLYDPLDNPVFETAVSGVSAVIVYLALVVYLSVSVLFMDRVDFTRGKLWPAAVYICATAVAYVFLLAAFPEMAQTRGDEPWTAMLTDLPRWMDSLKLLADIYVFGRNLLLICGVTSINTQRHTNRCVVPWLNYVTAVLRLIHFGMALRLVLGRLGAGAVRMREVLDTLHARGGELTAEDVIQALRAHGMTACSAALEQHMGTLTRKLADAQTRPRSTRSCRPRRCGLPRALTWTLFPLMPLFEHVWFLVRPQDYAFGVVDSW